VTGIATDCDLARHVAAGSMRPGLSIGRPVRREHGYKGAP
jgi:hypothetical protein